MKKKLFAVAVIGGAVAYLIYSGRGKEGLEQVKSGLDDLVNSAPVQQAAGAVVSAASTAAETVSSAASTAADTVSTGVGRD